MVGNSHKISAEALVASNWGDLSLSRMMKLLLTFRKRQEKILNGPV